MSQAWSQGYYYCWTCSRWRGIWTAGGASSSPLLKNRVTKQQLRDQRTANRPKKDVGGRQWSPASHCRKLYWFVSAELDTDETQEWVKLSCKKWRQVHFCTSKCNYKSWNHCEVCSGKKKYTRPRNRKRCSISAVIQKNTNQNPSSVPLVPMGWVVL